MFNYEEKKVEGECEYSSFVLQDNNCKIKMKFEK